MYICGPLLPELGKQAKTKETEKEIFRSGRRVKGIEIIKGKNGFGLGWWRKRLTIQSAIIFACTNNGLHSPPHPWREKKKNESQFSLSFYSIDLPVSAKYILRKKVQKLEHCSALWLVRPVTLPALGLFSTTTIAPTTQKTNIPSYP